MAKSLKGTIIALGKDTATVEVVRQVPHPLYRKLLKRSKKFRVSFAEGEAKMGDVIEIQETKPTSKNKHFKIARVVSAIGEVKG